MCEVTLAIHHNAATVLVMYALHAAHLSEVSRSLQSALEAPDGVLQTLLEAQARKLKAETQQKLEHNKRAGGKRVLAQCEGARSQSTR